MTPVPAMDPRLHHAVSETLKRPPQALYDLKKVKILNDFSYDGDPYYQHAHGDQGSEGFSAIGLMENLHTLLFGTPRSQQIPAVLVRDWSFLDQCKRLKKLDLRWTDFSDCSLLLQLPALKQVLLPARAQLAHREALDELTGRSVQLTFAASAPVVPAVRPPAQGGDKVKAIVEEIKKRTATDCYVLKIQPGVQPGLTDSKFGGLPYWDPALPYPVDRSGEKLVLLAQISFDQLPMDAPLPQGGMLQFFIAPNDSLGMDWDARDRQDGFRVVYHERIDPTVTPEQLQPLGIPTHGDVDWFPVLQGAAVTAEKTTAYMGPADGRFDRLFAQVWEDVTGSFSDLDFRVLLEKPDLDYLYEQLWSSGHHLLGWPCFEQYDPRGDDSPYDALLFQMDSDWTDDETYVMWADAGVGNFFIRREDLERRDFSDVFYTWDCG